MEETEVLKQVADAVTQKAVTFDIDIYPKSRIQQIMQRWGLMKKKRSFTINPLTLNQRTKISKILLPIDFKELTPDGILKLMADHSYSCAEIIGIAVTESRQNPSKGIVDMFFFNLSSDDLRVALQIVLQQMAVINFITTIASIRSLSTLEMKEHANVTSASKNEANPLTPGSEIAHGILSAVS